MSNYGKTSMFTEEAQFLQDLHGAMCMHGLSYDSHRMSPVIAGGYIRDKISGKDIRDVDIYISANNVEDAYKYLSGDTNPLWQDESAYCSGSNKREEYEHQCIQWQKEFKASTYLINRYPQMRLIDRPINLIALRWDYTHKCTTDPKEVVSKFNIGLSQFALTTMEQVYYSPQAYLDWKGQRITVLRDGWGAAGTIKSVEKLQAKYEWPVFFQDESAYSPAELIRREQVANSFPAHIGVAHEDTHGQIPYRHEDL